jgi:hypothetical protein
VSEEVRNKLLKYAKVRVRNDEKTEEKSKKKRKMSEFEDPVAVEAAEEGEK